MCFPPQPVSQFQSSLTKKHTEIWNIKACFYEIASWVKKRDPTAAMSIERMKFESSDMRKSTYLSENPWKKPHQIQASFTSLLKELFTFFTY